MTIVRNAQSSPELGPTGGLIFGGPSLSRIKPRWRVASLFFGLFVLLFSRSMFRPFDLDEHLFVAPSVVLDLQGAQPYRDFLYFHMPGQLYIYAALLRWVPYKLLGARIFAVTCGVAMVMLLLGFGLRLFQKLPRNQRWIFAGGMMICLVGSRLFTYTDGWAWNHDSAVLAAVAALLLHFRAARRGRVTDYFFCGVLAGLAVCIRLSFALMLLPHAVAVLLSKGPDDKLGVVQSGWPWRLCRLGVAMIGATLALIPAIFWLTRAPARFLFGIMGYQRFSRLYYIASEQKSMNVFHRILHFLQTMLSDPGNLAIFIGCMIAVTLLMRTIHRRGRDALRDRFELALTAGVLAVLLVGALGPSPSQYQYHYMLLPFMVVLIWRTIAARMDDPRWINGWLRGTKIAATIGLVGVHWYWRIFLLPKVSHWVPVQVHQTGLWVASQTGAQARVLTMDPLIPLEAGLNIYPQFAAGRFVELVGKFMPATERRQFSIVAGPDLDELMSQAPADAVLCDKELIPLVPEFVTYAHRRGFEPVDSPDGRYRLWVKPAAR